MKSPDNRHTLIVQHVPKKSLSESIAAQVGPPLSGHSPNSTEIGRPVLPRISAEPATRVYPAITLLAADRRNRFGVNDDRAQALLDKPVAL
jgi:hypothetical protein